MASTSIRPRPCDDPECRGQHVPAERVALAASICGARGVQLTALRQQILELLWETGQPAGAYELIDALRQKGSRPVGPPTVYRALEFLMSQGLVSKIESRNAYIPCAHPERRHDCLFFICMDCGVSVELENSQFEDLISETAALIGFRPNRRVIEVEGSCAKCVSAAAT